MNIQPKPQSHLYIEALDEIEKLKKQLRHELLKQFFWFYQIGERIEPFGHSFPTVGEVITRFGSEHFPKSFYCDYYSTFTIAVEHIALHGGLDVDKPNPPSYGWDWPHISSAIGGVKHSINGWRKAKQ